MIENTQVRQRVFSQSLVFGIAAFQLLWIAIFNGYPIFFYDTSGYVRESFTLWQSPNRSIIYSLFIRLVSLGISPWLVILAQCAITIYVLRSVFDYYVQETETGLERRSISFLALIAFLSLATSLPWHVGQLMPDVFTGLAFLCTFLLLYDSKISHEKLLLLAVILAISVGSHLSNFVSVAGVLVAVFVLRAFRGVRRFWPTQSTLKIAVFVLLPILTSAGLVGLSNWRSGYGFRLSAGTSIFMLNRLIESGLAEKYLEQECKIEQLTPCKYLPRLPRTDFMWGPHPLITEMGGWIGGGSEASKIVFGTIRRYPIQFLAECGKQMLRQVTLFRPGDENMPIETNVFDQFYVGDAPQYRLTLQSSGRLSRLERVIYPIYRTVFWGSLAVSLLLFMRGNSRFKPADCLFVLTLVFLLSNALITGAVSCTCNRFNSRVSWMTSLCCATYLVPFLLDHWNKRHTFLVS
jgi:hypothetical protein